MPIRTILLLFARGQPDGHALRGADAHLRKKVVLKGGAHTLGFLMAAMGLGALVSALSLAARRNVRGLVRMIPIAAAVFGAGLIGFGLSHWFWLSMATVFIAGMGMMQGMAASNTVIQTIVTDDKRGRVMSYYTMAFMGMAPFGSLLAGTMAHNFGAPFNSHDQRRGGPARRGMVHNALAGAASPDSPHLPRDGHPARRSRQWNDQRWRKLSCCPMHPSIRKASSTGTLCAESASDNLCPLAKQTRMNQACKPQAGEIKPCMTTATKHTSRTLRRPTRRNRISNLTGSALIWIGASGLPSSSSSRPSPSMSGPSISPWCPAPE